MGGICWPLCAYPRHAKGRAVMAAASLPSPAMLPPEAPRSGNTANPVSCIALSRRSTLAAAVSLVAVQVRRARADEAADELTQEIPRLLVRVIPKAKAAGLLRLAFHDAGTYDAGEGSGGMNGSILLELDRPENAGLDRSVKTLQKARREIEARGAVISWADMIALAGAAAVEVCGGPAIPVRLGRADARTVDPAGRLPEETLDAEGLKKCFARKGFSAQEMVVLSGAHTIGGKGFGSPNVFDNSYYRVLLEKPWATAGAGGGMAGMVGLPSDHALVEDEECLRWVKLYADDLGSFFQDFRAAYIKLVGLGAHWGG